MHPKLQAQTPQLKLRTTLKSLYLSQSSSILIFPHLDQLQHHPSNLAILIKNISHNKYKNKVRIIKWLATVTFVHPVLISQSISKIKQILQQKSIFQIPKSHVQMTSILQSINIFALIRGFDLQILNIICLPQLQQNNYQKGLWYNLLSKFNKQQYSLIEQTISAQTVNQIKQFFVQLYTLRDKTQKNIKQIMEKQQLGLSCQQRYLIHPIDIEIAAWNGITLVQYLPQNYNNEYIELWIDRTVQLNSLLGNFICKQKFGEFQYVKGPLAYAMQKGILLLLNNFQQISNQLLTNIQTLTQQMKVYHNQKTVTAKGGFKVLGICNMSQLSTKAKNTFNQNQYIQFLTQQKRSSLSLLPQIDNKTNKTYLIDIMKDHQLKYGYLSACKLWKRIVRNRKQYVDQGINLWQTYFTESFKSQIELQIHDLANTNQKNRTIQYEEHFKQIKIGRALIDISSSNKVSDKIVKTQYSLAILQKLAICMELAETPLLISQTGCGKTTLVQYLAQIYGHQLYVYNMSSGTDAMDLVGGFKPIDCRMLLKELFFRFIQKFRMIPGSQKNEGYIQNLMQMYQKDQLNRLLPSLCASISKIKQKISEQKQIKEWDQLKYKFDSINSNLDKIDSNLVFSFIQGNLIRAMKNGDWVLIDQINLASNDILQKVVPLIQGKSLLLYQKGDLSFIERHPDFRIIGCMNPANDSGKKALPINLFQKFTAMNLQQPSKIDIELMVQEICPQLNPSQISSIYFQVKKHKTVSLRNLSRCLAYLNRNKQIYTFKRALYDALLLGFQQKKILKAFQDISRPKCIQGFTQIQGFLVQNGPYTDQTKTQVFHLTQTFKQHLKDFLRAIAGTQLPVLLEGPTSAGKTSIIRYVASIANFKCIRINNHQHTEIQEYLGNYFPDTQGKLVFRQGPLVQAVRQGYWLILDELNLARTQILQCLNRLLDDNRQLFIPEQQKHIKPHKNFRIFATQNPSSYSGRKTLSRAFRNRFIALNFQDITVQDTMAIMKVRRPILADSKQLFVYVKKILQALQNYRSKQRVFSKDGMLTIRDLLKWTSRKFDDKQSFMKQGYALLAERLRTEAHEQKKFVQSVLLTNSKLKQIEMEKQYENVIEKQLPKQIRQQSNIYVQMNNSFKRMAALTFKAIRNQQPVLLVGQTGCGKTTLAQLIASISDKKFYSINCHKHTQASDLLGSLRPCTKINAVNKFQFVNGVVINAMLDGAVLLIDQINTAEDSVLQRLNQLLQSNQIGVQRGQGWQTIKAKPGFCIIATMNPSGDYGKKQLSPALRNRFTEIWVQPITHPQYLKQAKKDIIDMILHKLSLSKDKQIISCKQIITEMIFNFLQRYNCQLGPKNGLIKKLLTMRDINWICKFMIQAKMKQWITRYYWGFRILAIEGLNFIMGEMNDYATKLESMKQQLAIFLKLQIQKINPSFTQHQSIKQLEVIDILKQSNFPLLIKTDLPLQIIGIQPQQRIFFSAHTQLTDLLGQFHPQGQSFVWNDQILLDSVKKGKSVALYDMNLAQQPVIQGINSLFDYRGSLFIIQLNETYIKHENFRSIVVLKQTNIINDRKGLPNSFLNRFIKIRIQNVSKQRKLQYFKNKYSQLNDNFFMIIESLITKMKIQIIQYICQMATNGYMENALNILKLECNPQTFSALELKTISQFTNQKYDFCEQKIMQLLPLQETNLQDIRGLVSCYMTLVNTRFSVCLIGSMKQRESIVNSIAYLAKRQVKKVILSTMTDMAQLLGSYEQIDSYDQQKLQQNSLFRHQNQENQHKQTGAMFQYVKSRIIKTLEEPQKNILYIQVPNQSMLERLQKGIKSLYQQQVQIIVGINCLTTSTLGTSDASTSYLLRSNIKFIPVQLQTHKNLLQNNGQNAFIANYSQIKHRDIGLRTNQLSQFIKRQISESSERSIVRGWQKLYQLLCSQNIQNSFNNINVAYQQGDYERVWNNQLRKMGDHNLFENFRLKDKIIGKFNPQQLNRKQYSSSLIFPKNQPQLKLLYNIMILIRFGAHNIDSNMVFTNQSAMDQQSIRLKPYQKYQCLFLSQADRNFNQQTSKLLSLLYRNLTNTELFNKLLAETQDIFNQCLNRLHSQILIRFNQQQYKIVPILKTSFSIIYHILSNPHIFTTFNKLFFGNLLNFSSIHGNNSDQKSIIQYIQFLKIDINQCGSWLAKIHVRQLGLYDYLSKNLYALIDAAQQQAINIFNRFNQQQSLNTHQLGITEVKLLSSNNQDQLIMLEMGIKVYNTFKPIRNKDSNECSYINLLPHIQTEFHLLTLQQLSKQSQYFSKVYKKITLLKYHNYQPKSYKYAYNIQKQFQLQIQQARQKYIYRGYDNIRLLKEFYEKLNASCSSLESSNYQLSQIKQTIIEFYDGYYIQYRDILCPILGGLILIYHAKILMEKYKNCEKPITLSLIPKQKPFMQAIEQILTRQDEQFRDDAKDYTKFQRKFKKTVIVDQYSQEGVDKNKENDDLQFRQFFGKVTQVQADQNKDKTSLLDELFILLRKDNSVEYSELLKKIILQQCHSCQQLAIGMQLQFCLSKKLSAKPIINIYEQSNTHLVRDITAPINNILAQLKVLLRKYNIDNFKIIGTLCNKVQQQKVNQQLYKVLADCQYLTDKIFQINAILPSKQHIETNQIVSQCLRMRRIELKNWKSMLDYKIRRIQKSDTLQFITFFRKLNLITNIDNQTAQTPQKQQKLCFQFCDQFLSHAKLSCFDFRMYLLKTLVSNINKTHLKIGINRVIGFYTYLKDIVSQQSQIIKKQKIKDVQEYETLTSWNSNQYLIFKATCEKFQRKIHHILKKYQQEMSMQVGNLHQVYRNKQINGSIIEFESYHSSFVQVQVLENTNQFDTTVQTIFATISDIKQQHHNTQSRLLSIRNGLSELENIVDELSGSEILSKDHYNSKVLAQQMFPTNQLYKKAVKYYYGLWDKLCQKTQSAWNRQLVDRVWTISEKIWKKINSKIKDENYEISGQLDSQTQNLLLLYNNYFSAKLDESNSIFIQQIDRVKKFLRQKQQQFHYKICQKYQLLCNPQELVSLMKLGYIVACIALNLEKNGLCVKDNEQDNQQNQGTEEVGNGMGIGEGEAHQGAQNVGDQIQFEQQVLGNKNQQKNNQANANKKQEQDIQMNEDFQGQMHSKQQQNQDDDEGEQKQADQQMGQVDKQQKQKDMKNQEGNAQGKQQQDMEIQGQQDGDSELVDNQQHEKQTRKNQKKQQQDGQQQQQQDEQKSDWDDNNQQGQKINKRQAGQQLEQEQQDNNMDERSAQNISESGDIPQDQQGMQQQKNQHEEGNDENQGQEHQLDEQNKDQKQINQQEMEEQGQNEEQDENQKQAKANKTRKTNLEAYGRTDLNSTNPLKNSEQNPEKNQNQGQGQFQQAQGANDDNGGRNTNSIHSLSIQLLQQIQNLQRKMGNKDNFMKDLNVVQNDENAHQQQHQNNQQQYQLTQENNKVTTNLPAFLDQQNQQNKQQKQMQQQNNNKQRNEGDKNQQKANEQQQKNKKQQHKLQQKKSNRITNQQNKKQEVPDNKLASDKMDQENKMKNRKQVKNQQVKKKTNIVSIQQDNQEQLRGIVTQYHQPQAIQIQEDGQPQHQADTLLQQAYQVSKILQQQLKSVLEPLDSSEYSGDFKTGKKLNLKKIIPFIASNYRKDRIWLRRVEPNDRNYYIMLALDDTKSMLYNNVGTQALKGLLALSIALQSLNIKTCITGIKDTMHVFKKFQQLMDIKSIIKQFNFQHESKVSHDLSIASFVESSLKQFSQHESTEAGVQNKQICFIISDGKMNKDYVRPYLKDAKKKNIIYVFIIIDSEANSILNTKSAVMQDGKVKMKLYMTDFPFEYFLIVKNLQEMGEVLSLALMQFIQEK